MDIRAPNLECSLPLFIHREQRVWKHPNEFSVCELLGIELE